MSRGLIGIVTTVRSRSEPVAESSMTWADGALIVIDQRTLPHKTLAIRGAPALGVAGAFGVAYALADVPAVTAFLVRAISQRAARTGTTMYGPFKAENIVQFDGRTSPVASVTI